MRILTGVLYILQMGEDEDTLNPRLKPHIQSRLLSLREVLLKRSSEYPEVVHVVHQGNDFHISPACPELLSAEKQYAVAYGSGGRVDWSIVTDHLFESVVKAGLVPCRRCDEALIAHVEHVRQQLVAGEELPIDLEFEDY